ncbi:MAG TPA: sodium/solute symporter [Nevskiaceae bacterium]|nr:sodium/solute symporter [Nevskiaceae bacterium]
MAHLATLDYVAIAAYFIVTALIGWWSARGDTTAEDLFLAGRTLGPVAVGFSLYAANVSSDTLIGLPGAAYSTGISVANYEWMAGLVLIFTAVFVLPVILRAGVTTMPELMERRFDARLRKYLSAVTLFLSVVLDTASSLYAGSIVVMTFIPGFSLWQMCALVAAFTAIYTAVGGLRAVVRTDVMQAVVLLGGSIVLTVLVFGHFGYSWAAVRASVSPAKLRLLEPLSGPGVPWLGTLIGLPVAGFYYWTMNQYVIQRQLGARSFSAAGRAAVIASGLKLFNLFFMVLPGVMAIALLPKLAHPDAVYPEMVAHFAPVGVTGLIVAGLLAALMSSVSAILNSAATLITVDFIQPHWRHLDSRHLARIGRVLTLVIAVLAAAWAPMIRDFHGLFAYMQQLFGYVASPLVAVFLLGLWDRRLGPRAALRGLITGHVFSAVLFVLRQTGVVTIHFTIIAGVVCAATVVFTMGWKVVLGARDRLSAGDPRAKVVAREGLAGLPRDAVLGAAFILLSTVAMLVVFR